MKGNKLAGYRKRYRVRRYRKKDATMPMSRDPAKKRVFTAKIKENGVVKYIGTFDSMTDCIQAHRAYIRTLIS